MRIFLDTSVIFAACCSSHGASHEIFRIAPKQGWVLIATPYVFDEVFKNLDRLPVGAIDRWAKIQAAILVRDDVLTIDRPTSFTSAKDRPILFGAVAWADVLLTLDRNDFAELLDQSFYGVIILRPGIFLERQRAAGKLG